MDVHTVLPPLGGVAVSSGLLSVFSDVAKRRTDIHPMDVQHRQIQCQRVDFMDLHL